MLGLQRLFSGKHDPTEQFIELNNVIYANACSCVAPWRNMGTVPLSGAIHGNIVYWQHSTTVCICCH